MKDLKITWNDDALAMIIHRYTKEAGVRSLEREIATVGRKIAKRSKNFLSSLSLPLPPSSRAMLPPRASVPVIFVPRPG